MMVLSETLVFPPLDVFEFSNELLTVIIINLVDHSKDQNIPGNFRTNKQKPIKTHEFPKIN